MITTKLNRHNVETCHSDLRRYCFEQHPQDICVDKYRMSGFWDTPLDSILRTLGRTTLFFAGVDADQCVMLTLQDASCLGYDCILLADWLDSTEATVPLLKILECQMKLSAIEIRPKGFGHV